MVGVYHRRVTRLTGFSENDTQDALRPDWGECVEEEEEDEGAHRPRLDEAAEQAEDCSTARSMTHMSLRL